MSAPRNRYRIGEARAQMAAKLGGDKLVIELDDEFSVEVDHPLFRSREMKAALKPLDDDDSDGIARVILGEQYDAFIAHGGDPDDLIFVFLEVQESVQDTLAGRRRPTPSSAS